MRKRRRRSLGVALGIPLGAATGFAIWVASANGVDLAQAASRHAQDLLQLLDRRSPGARTAAQLTKTKHAQHARVSDREAGPAARPAVSLKNNPLELADILSSPTAPPQVGQSFAAIPSLAAVSDLLPAAGGTLESSIIPPGTETTTSVPPGENRQPVIETPAVPEPQSWALMLLGFAVVGWKVRRSNRVRRRLDAAAA